MNKASENYKYFRSLTLLFYLCVAASVTCCTFIPLCPDISPYCNFYLLIETNMNC